MPESTAIRDVLAERQRQIDKGYTAEHDDHHPVSQIIGYGWSQGMSWHPPHHSALDRKVTRAALVRLAACLIAGIEWLDRREGDGHA